MTSSRSTGYGSTGLSAALLISLIFFGAQSDTGNNGWLRFFGIGIQPTEIVKLAYIIVLAKQLAYLKEYKNLSSVVSIAQIVGHFILMFGLILVTAQDLGSALVYFFIFAVMLFVAGVKLYWFIMGAAAIAGMIPILWTYFLEDYQRNRILAPYDPSIDPTNQGINWAAAPGQNRHRPPADSPAPASARAPRASPTPSPASTRTSSSPSSARSWASSAPASSSCCSCNRHPRVQIGLRSGNTMSMLVCFGVASTVVFQTFENIGMCIGIAPVVGITLPFFSYGGSSLFSMFAAMGLVSGIKYRPKPTRAAIYGR